MKKNDTIKTAQLFAEKFEVQAYPTQDYYLRPLNDEYGTPSGTPFPKEKGVDCVFDNSDNLISVYIHTSRHNYFSTTKIATLEDNWTGAIPHYIVSVVLMGNPSYGDLDKVACDLKKDLIEKAHINR